MSLSVTTTEVEASDYFDVSLQHHGSKTVSPLPSVPIPQPGSPALRRALSRVPSVSISLPGSPSLPKKLPASPSVPKKLPQPPSVPDVKVLRSAIPAHCFQPSLRESLQYVARDLVLAGVLFKGALLLTAMEPSGLRTLLWTAYGILQGFVFTGVWILGHECGHDAFSLHRRFNAVMGFFLHSIVLVPFFSWKYSHSRHHRYANHMEKDTVFVPPRKSEFRSTLWTGHFLGEAEDAPIVSLILLAAHQLLGWPLYMMFNAGAGFKSLVLGDRGTSLRQSHFDPGADLFSKSEHPFIYLSTVGLAVVSYGLWLAAQQLGTQTVLMMYGLPYLWMNHWLVAITFLHHTHPDLSRFEEGAWTFQKGALSTVDREFGWIGKHLFHGIIEFHVVHHIFPRIPFYHAEEATKAIAPLLGKAYTAQKSTSFLQDLWSTFCNCRYVVEVDNFPGVARWAR